MALESVLSNEEKASLFIKDFIFHIIIEDENEPDYLDAIELNAAQKNFFRERIIEAASGTQYVFVNKETSQLYASANDILGDSENFLHQSKLIASHFHSHHTARTSDGVFIVALVSVKSHGTEVPLISLIKMDHKKVLKYNLQQTSEGRRATIEEITNSFVEDKSAMQKVAIIDIGEHFSWDILARERGTKEGVADYFKNFLAVTEREHASRLTEKAVKAVRQWAASQTGLPQDAASYKVRAIQYMNTHDSFETESFLDMVVYDNDEKRKKALMIALHDDLAKVGVAGQHFSPKPNILTTRTYTRNKYETREGVKIEFDGTAETRGVTIPANPDPGTGYFEIRILSRGIALVS